MSTPYIRTAESSRAADIIDRMYHHYGADAASYFVRAALHATTTRHPGASGGYFFRHFSRVIVELHDGQGAY